MRLKDLPKKKIEEIKEESIVDHMIKSRFKPFETGKSIFSQVVDVEKLEPISDQEKAVKEILKDLDEVAYDQPYLGTIEHSFAVQDYNHAQELAGHLQFPELGWHAKVTSDTPDRTGQLGEYTVTVVINVHRDNITK